MSLPVDNVGCRGLHSGLGRMPSLHRRRCMTWVSLLVPTSACVLHSTDSRSLRCRLASTAQYPTISSDVCFSDSGCRPCAVKVGLLQCYIGWPFCHLNQSPAVRALRSSSFNRWSSPLCLHHRHTCQFPLVTWSRANQVQTGGHHLQNSLRDYACVPVWSAEPRYWHAVWDLSEIQLQLLASNQLSVRTSRLVTVGEQSFASAGPKPRNSLPSDTTSVS